MSISCYLDTDNSLNMKSLSNIGKGKRRNEKSESDHMTVRVIIMGCLVLDSFEQFWAKIIFVLYMFSQF